MMGAGMPLAAHGLFVNLGINWGNTLLGCLTVLFIPIPYVPPRLRLKYPKLLHAAKQISRSSTERGGGANVICRFILFKFGPWLRNKSPRALHDDDLKKMSEKGERAV